jgi:MFS superfamily sulfate permease-like transporter
MILAAINNRVGTLIPPGPVTGGTTTTTMNSLTTNDFDSTATYVTTSSSTSTTSSPGNRYLSDDPAQARIMVGTALALVGGIIHLILAILHCGYVTVFLSDSIVQGFTTGCAIHIITSQIPTLLGIRIKTIDGQSKVIKVKKKKTKIFIDQKKENIVDDLGLELD